MALRKKKNRTFFSATLFNFDCFLSASFTPINSLLETIPLPVQLADDIVASLRLLGRGDKAQVADVHREIDTLRREANVLRLF